MRRRNFIKARVETCLNLINLYYDQQMHNYFTNYHIPTCFDITVSYLGSLKSIPCQGTQVFHMQLLVIQFTINMFHIGFMVL